MKTGAILCVVGNDTEDFMDDATLQGQIPTWADIVEIIARKTDILTSMTLGGN